MSKEAESAGPPGSASPCFKVHTNSELGRHVIATRFIPAGSVILKEHPLVIAPSAPDEADLTTCLGCCKEIAIPKRVQCAGCGGPLCSAACQDSPYHSDECAAMQKCNFRFKNGLISPNQFKMLSHLRVLLQKGDTAKRIRRLESHTKKMMAKPSVQRQMSLIVQEFMPPLLAYSLEERYWAFGVMEVNSFSYYERNEGRQASVLMDVLSLISHSCVCNAYGTCYSRPDGASGPAALEGLQKVLVAATDIEPGALITVNYSHPHMPTARRHEDLEPFRFFTCTCPRCSDPSELGMHTKAMCCVPCKNAGRLELPVPQHVGDKVSSWRCPKCRTVMATSPFEFEMQLACLAAALLASQRRGDVAAVEAFLERQLYPRGRLHPSHEIALDAKYALTTQMYGRLPGFNVEELSAKQLHLLSGHCRDYLRAVATAEPGYGLRMARVNLTLNRALLEIIKRTAKLPPVSLAQARLAEAEECLRKVQIALGHSSDMRSTLDEQQQQTEHARNVLGLLGVLHLTTVSQENAAS